MSSKTEDVAGILVYLATKYKLRIACLRRFQNKIDESVYSVLKRKINDDEKLKDHFKINNTSIESTTGSEFVFMGIQRNLEEIKGLDAIDITWIEESEKLTEEQWNLIRPTILRKDNSFIILVFNPYLATDFIYREFVMKQHDNVLVRHINYNENPFLSNSAKSLIESDKKNLSEDEFNHLYMGMPKLDDNDTIIKRSWLLAVVDAHIKLGISPVGDRCIGFDVADDGGDTNATVERMGCLLTDIDEWEAGEHELLKSAKRVYNKASSGGDLRAFINYDSVGVGASMGAKFKELNDGVSDRRFHIKFNGFSAGAGVIDPDKEYQHGKTNKQMFSNIKAQAWWNIADRLKTTYNAVEHNQPYDESDIISISSDVSHLEQLINELVTPKKDFDNFDRVKVESKKDLKKRGFKSPNIADAFIMSYFKVKTVNPLLAAMK